MHDLVIRGATVIDGTGRPGFGADVAVDDGVITEVGRLESSSTQRTIAADGLVLSPGFIDLHAHSDLVLLEKPEHDLKVMQGVTTELLGQDGLSYAPITPAALPVMRDMITAINGAPDIAYDWTTVAQFLAVLEAARPAVNAAYLVPHGALRLSVTGMADRAATDDEIAQMARMAASGMADGALGLSSGLTYPPATWSDTRELVGIARAIAPFRGIYVTHHRDYGPRLTESVEEALTIGRDAGVPVHFSHFHISGKPYAGRAGEFLSRIDRERLAGRDVTLDAYPYLAGSTFLGAWIPAHIMAGTTADAIERLSDPARQPALAAEIEAGPRDYVYTEWAEFQLSGVGSDADRDLEGLRIPAAAAKRGKGVGAFICDLLVASRMNVTILAFSGVEENVRRIMTHPAYMVGTDAILVGGSVHPRAAGTYPTVLGTYAREENVITLERAVNAMTGAPATRLGLTDRGVIRTGLAADLVLFDPTTVAARNSYQDSRVPPAGMPWVIINGVPVKADDQPTGARPGRIIRGDGQGEGTSEMSIEQRLAVLDSVPDTPVLVLDADVTRNNIEVMAALVRQGGKVLRPHAKTHKMLEVARMQLAAGAVGLQVAKLGEAEVFLDSGVQDIFIGYPVVGASKVARLLDLAERIRMSASLDDLAVAEPIGRAARERGLTIPIMLEVNTGLDRVGVLPEAAVEMAQRIADVPGLELRGVMTHEGQALSRSSTVEQLESETFAAAARLVEVAAAIRQRGLACSEVSMGSTATARFDARAPGITEVRPGTYVFYDGTMVAHEAATLEDVSVWAVATVVSRPSSDRAIVDAGSKVLSSDRINRVGAPSMVGQLVDRPDHHVVRVNEEHGVIATPPGSTLRIGDRVAIVPSHVCTAINLTDEVLVAQGGVIVDRWRVAARGRVQ